MVTSDHIRTRVSTKEIFGLEKNVTLSGFHAIVFDLQIVSQSSDAMNICKDFLISVSEVVLTGGVGGLRDGVL